MKALRCAYCKQILYPWQDQRETNRKVVLHEQCYRDIKALSKQDERIQGT